jgi:glycosyltransferase involved in cell wall biosynthesis
MNILYHHRIASKDGQFVHIHEIVTAMCKQGHQLRLVGPALHEKSDFGHDGGIVSSLKSGLPKFIYELLELGYSLVAGYKLIKAIKQDRPDVIYERYNLYQPAGVLVAKWFKIPLILEVNAPLKEERERYSGGLGLPALAKWIENYTWKNASLVLPVTNVLAGHCRRAGVKENNIDVIHNGVRESVLSDKKHKSTVLGETITIGFVGFMHLTCGVDEAMEVMAELGDPRLRLVCVGDGNVLPSLKERALALGVSGQVSFPGLVGRDDVLNFVESFDIALQPAVTAYASPLKMFEYMVMKCLVVAPNTPNVKEILHDDCAVFFDIDKKDGFKDSLKSALSNIDQYNLRRQNAYQRLVDGGFTWDNNVKRIVEHACRLKSLS